MAAIQKLSPELIGKIAAGEVVERPASVVKEMVENAIDAGATRITVEARGGGVEYLRVSDNGKGIPAEQIRLAFERHATSKLQTEEQLYGVQTLGFRGEALASVAAVAKVTCTTRTADAPYGVKCTVEGGVFTDVRQAASPVGTTFLVEELFFNTPVRRRFLKKPAVEAAAISDFMLRLILSHPEIAFRFASQGKTIYHSLGDGKLASALYCLYGKEAFEQMRPVEGNENGVLLGGYVGAGELSRGNRQQQSFFVNGRYFRSMALSRAVESGCEGRVMVGKRPMCALFLQMPYQAVDVNVHPNKLEVRFQDEAAVADAVRRLVAQAMGAEKLGQRLTAAAQESDGRQPFAEGKSADGIRVIEVERGQEMTESLPGPGGGGFVASAGGGDADAGGGVTSADGHGGVSADSGADMGNCDAGADDGVAASVDSGGGDAGVGGGVPIDSSPSAESPPSPLSALSPVILPAVASSSPRMNATSAPPLVARAMLNRPSVNPPSPAAPAENAFHPTPSPDVAPAPPPIPTQLGMLAEDGPELRLVGIVFDTYWIFQAGERLLLIDQHAAHERMLYDRMLERLGGAQPSQYLLSPRLVRLTPRDMALTDELREVLSSAGFQVERFDDRNIAIHAVPAVFSADADPAALFTETLDEWQAGRGQTTRERMRKQIAQMACKHAIKGGDKLNEKQVQGFLTEMLHSGSMPTCPHGRPIVAEVTRYALEKRFKRIQ